MMKSFLFVLLVVPFLTAASPPPEESLTPHQEAQVKSLLSLFHQFNETFLSLFQDDGDDHVNFCEVLFNETVTLELLNESVLRPLMEVDWEALRRPPPSVKATRTVVEMIEMWNYPVEVHTIETEDGFFLTAHRIPYGRSCGEAEGKRVVFLQHGLLGDSSNWVVTGPGDRGLAYLLADNCFDVWMGNYRGNTHSKRHRDSEDISNNKTFYNFSFHELGIYDLAASVDYVLNVTKASKLSYVGHSMGTTGMFILLSERPEYNARIEEFSALAPATNIKNMRSFIRIVACTPLRNALLAWLNGRGTYEILPNTAIAPLAFLCKVPVAWELCTTIFYFAGGWSPLQMDYTHLGWIVEHSPAGTSQETLIHFAQSYEKETFAKYDFGEAVNMEKYGQATPPEYDLSKVTVPVGLFWSDNDLLADRRDVRDLKAKLPNVKVNYRVEDNLFSHLDYVFARNQSGLVYRPMMEFILTGSIGGGDVKPPTSSSPHTALTLWSLLPLLMTPYF